MTAYENNATGSPVRLGRGEGQSHHRVVLALPPLVRKAGALVQGASAVVEERGADPLAIGGVLRVPLNDPAARLCDQVERAVQSDRRDPLAAVGLVNEYARQTVVRQSLSPASYSLRWWMFGSSSGVPNSHHATARSPSKTSAA